MNVNPTNGISFVGICIGGFLLWQCSIPWNHVSHDDERWRNRELFQHKRNSKRRFNGFFCGASIATGILYIVPVVDSRRSS